MPNTTVGMLGSHSTKYYPLAGFPVNLERENAYKFDRFFHPYVGEMMKKLNQSSLRDMLDPRFLEGWSKKVDLPPSDSFFSVYPDYVNELGETGAHAEAGPNDVDVSEGGAYSNYNWELLYHIPLTVAVHLSNNQRFAEAQRWFHLIFDPTSQDQASDGSREYWKFLAFRDGVKATSLEEDVRLLSTPTDRLSATELDSQKKVLSRYNNILRYSFHPYKAARSSNHQYLVVMKYLDNLIAWGDYLFVQDTLETINEATQIYVLAANILGERPEEVPSRGKTRASTFAELKKQLGKIGDGFIKQEAVFPLDLALGPFLNGRDNGKSSSLFGIGQTLYFCLPRNDKLLSYWDTVGDRLFKIRHGMNIEGVVRPLALFDPPIDPGLLVKAAAAGVDISSIVSGLNKPIGPIRCITLIQKSLEICNEVRSFGSALLAAWEKGEAEHLALVRQTNELNLQKMIREVRFLQWKQAQEATNTLFTNRATAIERLRYYQRLLNLSDDANAPNTLPDPDRNLVLTEENFNDVYQALVGAYAPVDPNKRVSLQPFPKLNLAGNSSPGFLSGYSGNGKVYLTNNEDTELNKHLPAARDLRLASSAARAVGSTVAYTPDAEVKGHYWGVGVGTKIGGGQVMAIIANIAGEICQMGATWEQDQAGMAARYAGYERRADDWVLQYNLAAHEVMQIGQQILGSLIAEQAAAREYDSVVNQINDTIEVNTYLQNKFTSEQLYGWMQGETARLYYEYYRFAFDTARKAEKTMKQELMRPEVDAQDFVQFNYWDGGRKGLLSGEALHLDLKRMEMAYYENNKREHELTRHVSLRQLDPLAVLQLRATGSCIFSIPEWLYDRDQQGHYCRRIKSVALSVPAVAASFTNITCMLSLLKSSIRKSPELKDGAYDRQGPEDDRFIDYLGSSESIVTSTGQNDSGMFETNLRDERFLPFEGAGAASTWKLEIAKEYMSWDLTTLFDVILSVRYTARLGVEPGKVKASLKDLFGDADQSNLLLFFSLCHDFPVEWSAFLSGKRLNTIIRRDYFPYFTVGKTLTVVGMDLYGEDLKHHAVGDPEAATNDLTGTQQHSLDLSGNDPTGMDPPGLTRVLTRDKSDVFLIIRYEIG